MDKKRLEWRVGLFVFIGLVLLAGLLLQFSKGLTFFHSTYQLRLKSANVGGLKTRSSVLMAGVQVGTVSDVNLAPDGRSVTIFLKIFSTYVIHSDAHFVIETSGFLGDQYVAIVPGDNTGYALTNNAQVDCEEPFNIQGVARAAEGFLKRVDETAKKLNDAVSDVRRLVLNEQTLTNLSVAVMNMRTASERAMGAIGDIDAMFATNSAYVSESVSNLVSSTEEFKQFGSGLNQLIATNQETIAAAVKNIESSTVAIKSMLEDVQAGKGPAGTLLRNEQVATNLILITDNLAITTSNLNRVGLWGILWSKKPPRTAPAGSPKTMSH